MATSNLAPRYTERDVMEILVQQETRLLNRAGAVARDAAESIVARSSTWSSHGAMYLPIQYQPARWLGGMYFGEGAVSGSVATVAAPVAVIDMPEMSAIETVPIEVKQEDLDDMGKQFAMEVESLLGYTNLRKKVNAPSQLRCLMAKLQIEVLNPEQVLAYKEQAKGHMKTAKKMSDPTWTVTPLSDYHQEIPHFVLSKALEIKKELPAAQFFVDHLQEDPFLIVTTAKTTDYGVIGRHGKLGERAKKGDDTLYLEVWNEKSFEAAL